MNEPQILPGCEVLPPENAPEPSRNGKASGKKTTRKEAALRFTVLNAFVDFTLAELCRGDLAVWLILFRDTRDGSAAPSQERIAERAGMSARSVRRSIERLRRRGLVKVPYRGGFNRGTSTYQVFPITEDTIASAALRTQ